MYSLDLVVSLQNHGKHCYKPLFIGKKDFYFDISHRQEFAERLNYEIMHNTLCVHRQVDKITFSENGNGRYEMA